MWFLETHSEQNLSHHVNKGITAPENGVISSVPFCLRSPVPLETCDFYSRAAASLRLLFVVLVLGKTFF